MTEADAHALERYRPPLGAMLEVGGLDDTPDCALMMVSIRCDPVKRTVLDTET